MPLYALTCIDKPNSLERRMATREAHVAYIRERLSAVKLAGPFLDEAETMIGSLLIVEADDLDGAKAFSAQDPYTLADLWQSVEIRPFRVSIGQL
jgi:uncharacterized protein YciI